MGKKAKKAWKKAGKLVKQAGKDLEKGVKSVGRRIDPTTTDGFLTLATMGAYGYAKRGAEVLKRAMSQDEGISDGTEAEKAAAEVALQEHDLARQLDYVKDEYAKRVDTLGSQGMQDAVTGRANIDAQASTDQLRNSQQLGLAQAGIDPSSGRASSTMTNVTAASGEAIGNAQSQAAFALDTTHLNSMANRVAMAQGDKTVAVAGLQDIAMGAQRESQAIAENKFNNKAANMQALGGLAGAGAMAYGWSQDK